MGNKDTKTKGNGFFYKKGGALPFLWLGGYYGGGHAICDFHMDEYFNSLESHPRIPTELAGI